jgi:hypothetical protein
MDITEATKEQLQKEIEDRNLREMWKLRRFFLPHGYFVMRIEEGFLESHIVVRQPRADDARILEKDPYFNPAKPDQGYTAR